MYILINVTMTVWRMRAPVDGLQVSGKVCPGGTDGMQTAAVAVAAAVTAAVADSEIQVRNVPIVCFCYASHVRAKCMQCVYTAPSQSV